MKNTFKILAGCILVLSAVFLLLLSNKLGGYRLFVVTSESMQPTIQKGSVAITQQSLLQNGDVITFIRPSKEKEFITHRIVNISTNSGVTVLRTKGDNNKTNDPWMLMKGGVVGKVLYVVPYLGYVLTYARTKTGLILFMLLPSFFLLFDEINNVHALIKYRQTDIDSSTKILAIMFLIFVLLPLHTSSALLSTSARLSGNKFTLSIAANTKSCSKNNSFEITNNAAGSNNSIQESSTCSTSVTQTDSSYIQNGISIKSN